MISARQLSTRSGTTGASAYINSSLRTLDTTGRATNSLFNQSICSNATWTTTTEINRSTSIVCLVKGRGKAITETGIASMDLRRNIVRMSQFCDDQLYSQLMTQVHMIDPAEIVVAQTLSESSVLDGMFDKLKRNFPAAKIQCVPRRYMNEIRGREFVKMLCSRDSSGVDVALHSKVYALLAVSGLLNYIEDCLSIYLAPHTVRMVYHSGANCMLMDHGTAVNLELLKSTASTGGNQMSQSLYSVINHTNTLTGSLTLRSNLLEPPTDRSLIEARYDAVEELTEDVDMFTSLQSALVKFPDIEKVISLAIQIPRQENRASAEAKIRNCLCLKTALDLVPCIVELLRPAKSPLIKNLRQKLKNDGIERVLRIIIDKLNSNASVSSGVLSMKGQVVFAVKTRLDGKLDAMREVYNSLIDQTEGMLRFLAETYQLALKLTYTQQRGFHVSMKIPKNSETPNIPSEFIKVCKSRGMYSMTTDKLVILNARITECMDSIYNLSNRVVTQMLSDIHKEIPCLNSLVYAIGHLDMLTAFASVSRQPEYIRPELGELLAIKTAKHPVADVTLSQPVVPNDIYVTPESNFMIITGANNSGKSFYLRTIAVLQVLAQIGCFVPASFAMIRICDQLFSRIGSDNSTSNIESSFTIQMKEIAFVLKHKTPSALIILDELCRGTASHEAVDICFTVCQQLLHISAFTLFATHYKELCQLESIHSNCTNFCFVTKYEDIETDSVAQKIFNDHKLRKGIARGTRYGNLSPNVLFTGLRLAATMNFSKDIISRAYNIADSLDGVQNGSLENSGSDSMTSSARESLDRIVNKVYDEMSLISRHGGSSVDKVALLRALQLKYSQRVQELQSYEAHHKKYNSDRRKQDGSSVTAGLRNSFPPDIRRINNGVLSSSAVTSGSALVNISSESGLCGAKGQTQSAAIHTLARTGCEEQHRSFLPNTGIEDMDVADTRKTLLELSSSRSHDTSDAENKLVDYSVSSIDLSGSEIHNPHSDVMSPVIARYRASTRKSRDPQSPVNMLSFSPNEHSFLKSNDSTNDNHNVVKSVKDEDNEDEIQKLLNCTTDSDSPKSMFSNTSYLMPTAGRNQQRDVSRNDNKEPSFFLGSGYESNSSSFLRLNSLPSSKVFRNQQRVPPLNRCKVAPTTTLHSATSTTRSNHAFNSLPIEDQTPSNSFSVSLQTNSSKGMEAKLHPLTSSEVPSKGSSDANPYSITDNSGQSHCDASARSQTESLAVNSLNLDAVAEERAMERVVVKECDKNIKDEFYVDISNISPIVGDMQSLLQLSDEEFDNNCVDTAGLLYSEDSLRSSKVSELLNKSMCERKVFAQKRTLLDATEESKPDGQSLKSTESGSSELSSKHKPFSGHDEMVLAGGPGTLLCPLNQSGIAESYTSKPKSVTFGDDEIIPSTRAMVRKKRRKVDRREMKSTIILRGADDSHKEITNISEGRIMNTSRQSVTTSNKSENGPKMNLLEDLLMAAQASKDGQCSQQDYCYSTVKIEPK